MGDEIFIDCVGDERYCCTLGRFIDLARVKVLLGVG